MAAVGGESYAGQRLGLPERGPRSVAGWGLRIGALLLDWFACSLVAAGLVGYPPAMAERPPGVHPYTWVLPLVFLLETTLLTVLVAGSFGQVVLRLAVVPIDGGRVRLLPALVRGIMVLLVVPPAIWDRDRRGLHDQAARTVVVRR